MLGFGNRSLPRADIDFAVVATEISGTGTGENAAEGFFAGRYEVSLLAVHLGLTWRFQERREH